MPVASEIEEGDGEIYIIGDMELNTNKSGSRELLSLKKAPSPPPPAPKKAPSPAPAKEVKAPPSPAPPAKEVKAPSPAPPARVKNRQPTLEEQLSRENQDWIKTTAGSEALKFCRTLGLENRPAILDNCLMDIRITGNNEIAKHGAIIAEEFRSKSKASNSKKYCVASGDPHFTSYDGQYYDLQVPGIYTIVRAGEDFEVQEKMILHSTRYRGGLPSCLEGLAFFYKDTIFEVSARDYQTVFVNGKKTQLTLNKQITVRGVDLFFGTTNFEWRDAKYQARAFKATLPNGFSLMSSGGYCGTLEINVPHEYYGKVQGLCGNADGKNNDDDYRQPRGDILNVNFGKKDWQFSGNEGPDSPMSKWQLSWKRVGDDCLFSSGCEKGVVQKKNVKEEPKPAPQVNRVAATTTTDRPQQTTTTAQPTTTARPQETTTTVRHQESTTTARPQQTTTTRPQSTPQPKVPERERRSRETANERVAIKGTSQLKYGNQTQHCITNVLAVKYDGLGGVYVSGANLNNRVDANTVGCPKGTDGWRKVIQFDPFAIANFVVDAQSFYEGHEDCGGTAYWKAHAPNEEFFQRCSWVDNSPQTVSVMTNVTLYPERVVRMYQRDMNHFLGQWYVLANGAPNGRDCLILTMFKHDKTYFIKQSRNNGNQVFSIRDHQIASINLKEQVYKMESGDVYKYRMTQYTIDGVEYNILQIYNINKPNDAYLLGEKIYSNLRVQELLRFYPGLTAIKSKCYSD